MHMYVEEIGVCVRHNRYNAIDVCMYVRIYERKATYSERLEQVARVLEAVPPVMVGVRGRHRRLPLTRFHRHTM